MRSGKHLDIPESCIQLRESPQSGFREIDLAFHRPLFIDLDEGV